MKLSSLRKYDKINLINYCLEDTKMTIYYNFLFNLMNDKKMSSVQIKENDGFSVNIITNLKCGMSMFLSRVLTVFLCVERTIWRITLILSLNVTITLETMIIKFS